ncbi:MAG: enoyl-CoA hydratase/isomerase family protein [Burkholderiaceae bacterium]
MYAPEFVPIANHEHAPLLQRHERIWTLQLNRPAEHNRLDPLDVDAMHEVFGQAQTEQPAALVITGSGQRTFSSGYTLSAITSELDSRFENMLDRLETLPMLTIAAINGGLYGGATDLALCCDIRIGVTGMKMFMPAAKFGLHYYPGGLKRYVHRLGLPTASRLMLTAMTMRDEELLRVGYLTELVAPEELSHRVSAYTGAAIENEPGVVAEMKSQMRLLAAQLSDSAVAELEQAMQKANENSLSSEALHARVAAQLNTPRKPK